MSISTHAQSTFVPAESGDAFQIIGEKLTFKITSAASESQLALLVLEAPPGVGPPIHTHRSAEIVYVLEGRFKLSTQKQDQIVEFLAGPGDSLFIPANTLHTIQGAGEGVSKSVLIFTPGNDMEQFFREVGTPVPEPEGPLDFGKAMAAAGTVGMTFPPEFLPEVLRQHAS